MLSELEDIVDRAHGADAMSLGDDLRALAQEILHRQFIFADDHGMRRKYDLMRDHRAYFVGLFDALNLDFQIDESERFAGITSRPGTELRRLDIEETLFLIALRILHDQRTREYLLEEGGRSRVLMSEIWNLIDERTRRPRLPMSRCRQIVAEFRTHGIVRIVEEELNDDALIEIRPVIRRVVNGVTAESLEAYIRQKNRIGAATEPNGEE
jgi:hypothetical protein